MLQAMTCGLLKSGRIVRSLVDPSFRCSRDQLHWLPLLRAHHQGQAQISAVGSCWKRWVWIRLRASTK